MVRRPKAAGLNREFVTAARKGTVALLRWSSRISWSRTRKSPYLGHRFLEAVISCAVRGYYRLQLGLRDIAEWLFETARTIVTDQLRSYPAAKAEILKSGRSQTRFHQCQ